MKKGKLLLCVLLAFVLGVTPGLSVNAAEVSTGTIVYDGDTGAEVDSITTHVFTTGDDKDLDTVKGFYVSVPATATNQIGAFESVVPLEVTTTGLLYCAAGFDSTSTTNHPTATGSFDIYTDAACTDRIIGSEYDSYYTYKLEDAGTYYIKFDVSDSTSDGVTPYEFYFASQMGSSANRTLTKDEWAYSSIIDTSKPTYFKVKTTKTGSITYNFETEYSAYVTLCNSSKKAISNKVYVSASLGKAVFTVKKGTYYIKVDSVSDQLYGKYTFKALSDKSGTSKAKAKKLSLGGSTVTATALASDKSGKVDWYKFTLTKAKKVNITFKGSVSSGEIELVLFSSAISGTTGTTITTVDSDASFSPQTLLSTKLPKGTYYIKVIKKTAKTSGFYNLKVK